MKYTCLDNQPNITQSRSVSSSPSLKLDYRTFPHVTYLQKELGRFSVNYTYWDGLKWSYKDVPKIYVSKQEIISSPNSLVLDDSENPIVVFARKIGIGNRLTLASYNDGWDFNTLDVDYDLNWIGVTKQYRYMFYSSSSSSSTSYVKNWSSSSSSSSSSSYVENWSTSSNSSGSSSSTSSSSISSYIENWSTSSNSDTTSSISSSSSSYVLNWSSSSSSSSYVLNWSSSSDSSSSSSSSISSSSSSSSSSISSSSSSSSYDDAQYFVTIYDTTNDEFKVYAVSNIWRLMGSKSAVPSSCIKIDSCGRKVGIAFIDSLLNIQCNFFDLQYESWDFANFTTLVNSQTYDNILDMDVAGYSAEEIGILSVGWLSKGDEYFYVCSERMNSDGTEIPTDGVNVVVESNSIDVTTDYVVNGYKKVGVYKEGDYTGLFCIGASSKSFVCFQNNIWINNLIDIGGISNGIVCNGIRNQNGKIVLSCDSGDIYYYEQDLINYGFDVSDANMVLLNDKWARHVNYSSGEMGGDNVSGTYDTNCGDILGDSIQKVMVVSNEFIVPPVTTTTTTLFPTTTTTTTGITCFTVTARDSNRVWTSIASSSDGGKLVACVSGGQIYTSTDSGVNWTPRDSNRGWWSVASSADGSKLVACELHGQIYTSTDSGVTWTPRYVYKDYWNSVASSSDGSKLVACIDSGQIYTSTDSGVNWTPRDSNRSWQSVTSSTDGSSLAACVHNGQIYTSTDYGVTWTARNSNRYWESIASSWDGSKLVACVNGGQIYTSTDSGVNWTPRDSNRNWNSVASSFDGTKLIACVTADKLYNSTDSGVTWTPRDSNRIWWGVTSSSDGTKLAAIVYTGQIYTIQNNCP